MQTEHDNLTGVHAADIAKMKVRAPGKYRVIRRNGNITGYHREKISSAITKAFVAIEGAHPHTMNSFAETVAKLTAIVENTLIRRKPDGGTFHIEEIQDQVELSLMREEHHKVARAYGIYREQRNKKRLHNTP